MRGLSSASNVLVPAYLTLIHKCFSIRTTGNDGNELWHAEKDDYHFTAEDPLLLLGVVAVYKNRGDSWQADDDQIEGFLKQYYPEA